MAYEVAARAERRVARVNSPLDGALV